MLYTHLTKNVGGLILSQIQEIKEANLEQENLFLPRCQYIAKYCRDRLLSSMISAFFSNDIIMRLSS
ncbi:hypothetical protein ACJX0J_011438, partial [Zea mays]